MQYQLPIGPAAPPGGAELPELAGAPSRDAGRIERAGAPPRDAGPRLVLSRSALERFIRCARCFWLEKRRDVRPPAMVPMTLAVATDALLKNEFDQVRASGARHPLWEREHLRVAAFAHPNLDDWRNNRRGIRALHAASDTEVYGSVDDLWRNLDDDSLHIVDYKSTSKQGEPSLNGGWGEQYKRQIEIYQWLFEQNGFPVNHAAYFLYVNASKSGTFFDPSLTGRMSFVATLHVHAGSTGWVADAIAAAAACARGDDLPASGADCDNCRYYEQREGALRQA